MIDVENKLENVNDVDSLLEVFEPLNLEEKQALAEAERLADLFEDIKPETTIVASKYLFSLPAVD